VVLILDELHELLYTYRRASFFACIEVIREIYDEVECGMILCGTKLLEEGLQAGKDREMQQIMRRGVHRVSLPDMPTRGDLAAILKANGLEFPDKAARVTVQRIEERPYELLRMLAKRAGLKAITERLRYARKLASRRNKDLAWEHFVEAHLTIEKETQPENDWE
jgi:DNA transposition AAA+ family ATPase